MASISHFGLLVLLLHFGSHTEACENITNESTDVRVLANMPTRLAQTVAKLECFVSRIEAKLALVEREYQEERSSHKKKCMLEEDIVTAINQGRFAIAEEKMLELEDSTIVADIVCGIATKSDHDFGWLVNLAKTLSSTSLRTQVLLILYNQAKDSDQISTLHLVALAKCLSEKEKGFQDSKIIGITTFKKLFDKITENIIATFIHVLKWQGDYQTNSEVRALAADIADWRDVSEKVMNGLVSGVFRTVGSIKILEAVSNHTDAWQALIGVDTLIDRLKDSDSLKGTIAWNITDYLNEFVTRKNLPSTVQDYASRVRDKIPDCIVKLASLTTTVVGTVDVKNIFEESCNRTDAWQALLVVDTLIDRLKDTDSLKGTIAWNITDYLNEFVTRKNLPSTVQDYASRVRDKIPDCIVKLASLTTTVVGTVDVKNIFEESCNRTDAWQALLVVDTLIDRLKDTDSLKGTITWDIADYLNEFATRKNLPSSVQDYASRVKDKIPDCIAKLTTFNKVCIRSKYKKSLLKWSRLHHRDYDIGIIVVGLQRNVDNTARWRHQRKGERLFFENIDMAAILHSTNVSDAGFNRVFTTKQKGDFQDKYAWILEPAGDGCFLKNSLSNGYLFNHDTKCSIDMKWCTVAGTNVKKSSSADDNRELVWQIVGC